MKQAFLSPAPILIALGVILFADAAFSFDAATGFWAGSTIARYLVFAMALLYIWLFSRSRIQASPQDTQPRKGKMVFTIAGAASVFYSVSIVVFSAMGIESAPTGHHTNAFAQALNAMADVACAVLFMGMAVWFSVIARKFLSSQGNASPNGLLLSGAVILLGPVIVLLRQAVFRSVSSHRLSVVIPVFAMLFSFGFLIALCRFLFTDGTDCARRVVFWGWSIFFFGVCLALPQTLYLSFIEPYCQALIPQAVFCAAIGILGAYAAVWARRSTQADGNGSPSPLQDRTA